jgi:hypothetical protein
MTFRSLSQSKGLQQAQARGGVGQAVSGVNRG